ncbi:MFS transporter [Fictibacillus gelatini]|uniref:MFS transporter n=1 Tax=Fictibacillus gelatini TaxID=225985 RepID=UPI0005561C13|nr:MFS transporter [Fictibacillus gelatini]
MEAPHEKLWTKNFIILTICNLLLFLNIQMITPAVPAYVKDAFHSNDFTVSIVISVFAFAAIVARVIAGEAIKKGQRDLILLIGLFVLILSTAGYFWSSSIALLLLIRIIYGIGFGLTSTTFPTTASDIIPPRKMGEGMGYFGLSTSLSMSIAPVIGLGLLGKFGFPTLIGVTTLLTVLIFPLSKIIRMPSSKSVPFQEISKHSSKVQLMDKKIILPVFLNLLLSITYGGLISFLALFGKEVHLSNVGWFFLCNAFAVLLVRPISGKIFDKKGHLAVLPPGALLVMIGLLSLSFTTSMKFLLISALFYGLGYGMLQPSIQAWTIKQVTPEKRGMANGAFLNSIDLGVAIGSMLLGIIATNTSYSMMYRLSALCMVVLLVVYLLSQIKKLQRSKNKKVEEKMSA